MNYWLSLLFGIAYGSFMLGLNMFVAYASTRERLKKFRYLRDINGKPYHLWGERVPTVALTSLTAVCAASMTRGWGGTVGEALAAGTSTLIIFVVGMSLHRSRYQKKYQGRIHPLALSASQ